MEMILSFIIGLLVWLLNLVSSALFFLLILPLALMALFVQMRILNRAGLSGWWALLSLFPPAWIVGVWLFAFSRWPAEDDPAIEIIPPGR